MEFAADVLAVIGETRQGDLRAADIDHEPSWPIEDIDAVVLGEHVVRYSGAFVVPRHDEDRYALVRHPLER